VIGGVPGRVHDANLVVAEGDRALGALRLKPPGFRIEEAELKAAFSPRTKLILVGSHHMLDADQFDENQKETIDMLRDLIGSCHHITVPNGILD